MNSFKLNRSGVALLALCLASTLLAGALGVGTIRTYGKEYFLRIDPPHIAKTNLPLASAWLDSVLKDDSRKALAIAARIVPESEDFIMPRPEYLGAICDFRIRLGFLTAPFNVADFARWRDLVELKDLSESLNDSAPELFKAVMEHVRNPSPDEKPHLPPIATMDNWRNGKGNSSERARLLCALAYQAGYECNVVGLVRGRALSQELCLLSRGEEAWVADCATGSLKKGPWQFDAKPDVPETTPAPTEKNGRTNAESFVYFTTAEPQDFRNANSELFLRLKEFGIKKMPRMPQNPQTLIEELKAKTSGFAFASHWQTPFMALGSVKEAADFWLLDAGK